MLKSHVTFHSSNGKRLALIAEDEEINRLLLEEILKEDYKLIFASDGLEAYKLIQEYQNTLSIILLDLQMPGMGGLELLQKLKDDVALQLIPVIVITSDQDSEIKSLTLGAADFIPKPYPAPGVILARVRRTVELFEDRITIQTTERDPLTNLYNREFFYHYAELFDQYHESMDMDAIIIDIYHFRVINERFGNAYGDEILRRIGLKVRDTVADTGGIVCRREADTFMVYCPHGKNYRQILDSASNGLGDDMPISRIRLRMGVYAKVDRSLPIERRFDRAKMAVDVIRNSYTKTIEFYDNRLYEKEVFEQQLVEGFHQAVNTRQFKIYYQPKFNIRGEMPVLCSAEALVRWIHPQFGFISPGQFIPLFESNGLIEELDLYVWREIAAQIREWKDRLNFSVPVSANVSRVDMYDPNLPQTIQNILKNNDLKPSDILLEVTESAYTQNSEQIISTVEYMRKSGFKIEMDDFGNGYSSLNMLSTLPIDALKLDMEFVQNAFRKLKDTRLLEIIIDIARYLSVPVIAEGVETEEQYEALKAIGCDIIQGYYFSRPVPPNEFENFLLERRKLGDKIMPAAEIQSSSFEHITDSLTGGFDNIYYIDINNDHYIEFLTEGQQHEELKIDKSGKNFFTDIIPMIRRAVHPDDQEELIRAIQKDNLLRELDQAQPFSMIFRMMINQEPVYYAIKAVRAPRSDHHHIVAGITNVDHELKTFGAFELVQPNAVNFNGLAHALSVDMESIYYVDVVTDTYIEFKADSPYKQIPMENTGRNFFEEYRRNLMRVIYEADRDKIRSALDKSFILEYLNHHKVFAMVYRIMINGSPVYYRMKIIHAHNDHNRHIIIGISNIDDQITEEEKQETTYRDIVTFAGIAKALAQDYFSIYIVDMNTDRFYEYNSLSSYRDLNIENNGEDFFSLSRRNAEKIIYPEDLPHFLNTFTKSNIQDSLQKNNVFTMTYRLMINNQPNYVSMKISLLSEDDLSKVVIGINNIQAGMDRREQPHLFNSISKALAGDYFRIYYLDTQTDDYIEFVTHEDHEALEVEKSGTDFFNSFRRIIRNIIHPDDEERFLADFTRENFYTQLIAGHPYIITYRQLQNKHWIYVQLKAVTTEKVNDTHIIIGISNIDDHVRREEQSIEAIRLANLDNLTGVKSYQVYEEDVKKIDKTILNGTISPFAIVCCDLNNLKKINETYGHAEGDEFIKQTARMVCNVYRHSTVYRTGSGRFTAILQDDNYQKREYLYKMMTALNYARPVGRKITIAVGMSEYNPERDTCFSDTENRAIKAMKENKKILKQTAEQGG